VSVRVAPGEAEIARARMLELAPAGFEEREGGGVVELAAYVEERDAERIAAAFADTSWAEVEPGWEHRWREFHRPVRAGGLWIGPPWETPPEGEPAVVVDPGRAFGTGAHPTTRACVELLAGLERGSLLDAGCGSGVLAVAAVRLGFGPVIAVDFDPVAVETAARTAAANGVEIRVEAADVLVDALPEADLVVANIELRVVEGLLARRPAPVAVTAGYLVAETPDVPGWAHAARVVVDGWAADVLRRAG
jgi:ribosomal protein L11 methyltransferase